jgi:hypothetical protein
LYRNSVGQSDLCSRCCLSSRIIGIKQIINFFLEYLSIFQHLKS